MMVNGAMATGSYAALIVSDEPGRQIALKRILAEKLRISTYPDVVSALTVIETTKPDVVVIQHQTASDNAVQTLTAKAARLEKTPRFLIISPENTEYSVSFNAGRVDGIQISSPFSAGS
ncbi:MAG: hypothetical protein HOH04_16800, partial [Rhodospirillaceae bacterium]|nr:hypothetical protein [Rhodospirillaceae bacterium]